MKSKPTPIRSAVNALKAEVQQKAAAVEAPPAPTPADQNAAAMQALLDALSNQRNGAMNQLAQAQASCAVLNAEVERLTKRVQELEAKQVAQ